MITVSKRLAVTIIALFLVCSAIAGAGGAAIGASFSRGPAGPAGPQGYEGRQGPSGDLGDATCYFTGQTDADTGTPLCVYGRPAQ